MTTYRDLSRFAGRLAGLLCLLRAGCAANWTLLSDRVPAAHAAHIGTCPTCAAPQSVVTTAPVAQPAALNPPVTGVPPVPVGSTPPSLPADPAVQATTVPNPAVTQGAPAEPQNVLTPFPPTIPESDQTDKLRECENQLASMHRQLSDLEQQKKAQLSSMDMLMREQMALKEQLDRQRSDEAERWKFVSESLGRLTEIAPEPAPSRSTAPGPIQPVPKVGTDKAAGSQRTLPPASGSL